MTDAVAAFTDREFHKTAPVPDTGRPSIYEFRQPSDHDLGWFLDHYIPLPSHGRVLDAGCGPGAYVAETRRRLSADGVLAALDINSSRVAMIDASLALRVAGDVTALPFPDAAFDVVLAMHMLYHVPHVPDAVAELRRVLKPGTGVLYAFTNSERAQWELAELYLRHGGDDEKAFGDTHFSNESGGALLRTAFADDEVSLLELTDTQLVVTDAECIVDELQRLRYTLEPGLRAGASWDEMIEGARHDARESVEREGAFRMSENHGLFTCHRLS